MEAAEFGGFPASFIAVLYADGAGRITMFRLTENVNTPEDFMGFFVLERDPIAEGAVPHIDYTVGPDCRGTISWLDQTPFMADEATELPFVLVNGGREGWAIRTMPGSVLLMPFKRVDAFDQQLEAKVDANSAQLAAIKQLLDRIAIRLSIVP